MSKKYIFIAFAAINFFCFGCSTTPSIKTKHRYIPSKKNEPVAHKKNSDPSASSAATASTTNAVSAASSVAVTEAPAAEPVAVEKSTQFELKKEDSAKPRSEIVYPENPKKIGVILPITGKNSTLGQRALNAIRLGLGLDGKDPSFSISIYDSQSSPDTAAKGVEKLLRDDNVIAILGGLSAKEAQAISAKSEYFQVPFFAFSQKSGLTNNTDFTFRNSVTPEMQAERLVRYSLKNLGAKRFAILYPNDPYGVEFTNKFWDLVLAGGAEVTAAQAYDPKDTDLNIYIQKLVGTYFSDARLDEYRKRQYEIAVKNKKKQQAPGYKKSSRENEAKENVLSAIVDFDVLFVPDSSKALGQVMAFMKNNDVLQMTYVGTNLWNTPDLARRVGADSANIFFVDANTTAAEIQNSSFHNRYLQTYQEAPSLVEAQIYEAALIIRDIIRNNSISRNALASQIKILGRKDGAYSEIRMNNNHEIERKLNIFGITEGAISVIE